jgi:SET domain/Rubisco LSMT substrate-binding
MSGFADSVEMEHMQSLMKLVSSHGGTVSDSIEFRYTDDAGTGVFATKCIDAGETLISVPFSECISMESVSKSGLKKVVEEQPGLLEYQDEVIALGLLYAVTLKQQVAQGSLNEADALKGCPWLSHLKTIPLSYNTPLFWSDAELDETKGCTVFHLTNLMKRQMAADWEALHEPLSHSYPELLGAATLELYQWALTTVYSRAVGAQRRGVYTRCIPPVVDMANHNPEAGTETADTLFYDERTDTVSFINMIPKQPGEECFAVYGTYPNGKLLYSYGFVIPNNPYRAVDLWTRVTPQQSNAVQKQQILSSHDLTKNQAYDFEGTLKPQWISPALLATIRVIQADESEMALIENAFKGKMISVRNEKASYVSLRNLLIAAMRVQTAEVRTNNAAHEQSWSTYT